MDPETLAVVLNRSEDLGMYRERCDKLENEIADLLMRVSDLERKLELAEDIGIKVGQALARESNPGE
jgi:predicted nuclease with TOPRIM domain